MKQITNEDADFIVASLNQTWNDTQQKLREGRLGDIERKNYEDVATKSKELMTKLSSHNTRLEIIITGHDCKVQHCDVLDCYVLANALEPTKKGHYFVIFGNGTLGSSFYDGEHWKVDVDGTTVVYWLLRT